MQSPKFPRIADSLGKVLSPYSFRQIWKHKIRSRLRNSPLRDPIDNFDFHLNLDQRTSGLSTRIRDGRYTPFGHKRYTVEKSKGLCRQLVSPSVEDCLVLQSLSDSLYHQIKSAQPTEKAYYLPTDGSFNSKFHEVASSPYGSIKAWVDFQKQLFEFTKTYKYIVVTDVANYYDFIKYDHLRNVIASFATQSEEVLDILIFVLSGLAWQPDYMPRQLTGLPQIDIDAPRLLAHSFLFEVDRYINETSKLDHVRFMDDIDVGANSIQEAKRVLRDIDLIIQSRQVRLNSGKTKILRSDEAYEYFQVRQNHVLSKWQAHLDWKRKSGFSWNSDRQRLVRIVKEGLSAGNFDQGNGEKILKRLLTTATKIKAEIRLTDLERIIKFRPGVRANAIWHLGNRQLGVPEIRMIHRAIKQEIFVDDQAFFDIVKMLLEARVRLDRRIKFMIREIADYLLDYSEFGIFLSQRLSARFLTDGQTLHFTGQRRKVWAPDVVLGRHIAAVWPYFLNSPQKGTFRNSILAANNAGANDIMEFLDDLATGVIPKAVLSYAGALNTTLPLQANFEKIGMLIAMSGNSNLAPAQKAKLMAKHTILMSDPYYGPHLR